MAFDEVTEQAATRSITRAAMRAEMLDAETEIALARAWRDHRDQRALHRLISAYLRLAISMSARFRRYGVSPADLVQEASLALLVAAERFDPDRGVRFSTYAVWWIKAGMQDYVMRNWSVVRTGSTTPQKALFFNMRRVQSRIEREALAVAVELPRHELHQMIAREIGVPLHDVVMMDGRLAGGDASLDVSQSVGEEGRAWVETIEDDTPGAEMVVSEAHDRAQLRQWLASALADLTDRERRIICERKLRDTPRTLEELGVELGLSKERVRQLEVSAFSKMRQTLTTRAPEVLNFL